MTEFKITADGNLAALAEMHDWLSREPELRGRVRQLPGDAQPGTMGAWTEIVVTIASSSTATVLARSLQVWFVQSRSDIKAKVTGSDGRSVDIDAKRVGDVSQLMNEIARLTEPSQDSRKNA